MQRPMHDSVIIPRPSSATLVTHPHPSYDRPTPSVLPPLHISTAPFASLEKLSNMDTLWNNMHQVKHELPVRPNSSMASLTSHWSRTMSDASTLSEPLIVHKPQAIPVFQEPARLSTYNMTSIEEILLQTQAFDYKDASCAIPLPSYVSTPGVTHLSASTMSTDTLSDLLPDLSTSSLFSNHTGLEDLPDIQIPSTPSPSIASHVSRTMTPNSLASPSILQLHRPLSRQKMAKPPLTPQSIMAPIAYRNTTDTPFLSHSPTYSLDSIFSDSDTGLGHVTRPMSVSCSRQAALLESDWSSELTTGALITSLSSNTGSTTGTTTATTATTATTDTLSDDDTILHNYLSHQGTRKRRSISSPSHFADGSHFDMLKSMHPRIVMDEDDMNTTKMSDEDDRHVYRTKNPPGIKTTSFMAQVNVKGLTRKFSCPLCDKRFFKSQDLKRHIVTHDKQNRPFKCSKCSFSFTRKDSLHRHELKICK